MQIHMIIKVLRITAIQFEHVKTYQMFLYLTQFNISSLVTLKISHVYINICVYLYICVCICIHMCIYVHVRMLLCGLFCCKPK